MCIYFLIKGKYILRKKLPPPPHTHKHIMIIINWSLLKAPVTVSGKGLGKPRESKIGGFMVERGGGQKANSADASGKE